MKKILTTVLLATALASPAFATTLKAGYELTGEPDFWGTEKAEIYNAAILIGDASLIGKKVTAIEFTWKEGVTATDCQVFLASELKIKSGVATADIATASFASPEAGVCTVTLAEPWTVDRGSFYAGYSFKVGNPKNDEALGAPVAVGRCASDEARYIATSRTYKGWQKPAVLVGCGLTLRAVIEGDSSEDAAGVKSVTNPVTTADAAASCTAVIVNHGSKEVRDIEYTYTVDGQTIPGKHSFDTPISAALYGTAGTMTFEAPLIAGKGEHAGTLTITKVNGVDNEDIMASAQNTISVADQIAKHVVVMEEFTGTWCQWCTRGYVAMRMLNERLGDSFIALSYHSGDPMEVTSEFPVKVDGFPGASIDRGALCDPYYGNGDDDLGILKEIEDRFAGTVPANISVSAEYSADGTSIDVDASAYFFRTYTDNPYRIAYVLTADGLKGAEDEGGWYQSNAYYNLSSTELPGGEDFCRPNGQHYMLLTFDDVVVAYSPYAGEEGSLPSEVKFADIYSHTYTFDVSCIKEDATTGKPEKDLIQHKDRVFVTALLIDSETGRIVNAAKCHVADGGETGVSSVGAEREVESVEYFDISGRRIGRAGAAGPVIVRTRYADGSQDTVKRFL